MSGVRHSSIGMSSKNPVVLFKTLANKSPKPWKTLGIDECKAGARRASQSRRSMQGVRVNLGEACKACESI
jgi:hypothetical protein